ncbi:chitin-binding protein [Streptomyces sp. RLB3-17]|uniref:Lytic polysaccharide monooxygenase n=1 Tax=Streptomyces mirabilis TaxID=68239 RepID=A0ABU3UIM9_9ACTN|nr:MULTISPECIES: lytic polysaccharide monooxygenase [Streptomyces]MCX4612528.1 lytic polysaccharide monooxygenase [Streptomyces mirabilis]MCX5352751.1 lytic polysaccharide monooxygenase [Streptomyces mirabilis]MDU8993767.1 lytic polysaccharide monooxygenase [Streptomyces mirabilis]NMI61708.1 chitin-binding protein [Streptomyces sp. RLA2-12]QDN60782.1 chitin-binding protein [Streptomyces sp. S1D4-20]
MTAHRTATAAAVAVAAPLLLLTWAAGPAQAHGAPTDPVSRVVACSPEGGSNTGTAACRAAIAANGAPFTAWDNLRVAGVGGRDRQVIPDGQLCSGGLPAYKGLNLARADWPSTRMTPGATFTLSYSSTIPHTGTFKLYLSKPGYDPTKPLKWSDLPTKPFATATDPALVNGAYRIKATLPSDRTGRQMLYTIWQNTSTSDTYYSCSDVVFPTASGGGAAAPTTSSPARTTPTANRTAQRSQEPTATTATPGDRSPSPAPETTAATTEVTAPDHLAPAADSSSGGSNTLPLVAGAGGAVAFLLTAGVAITLRRRR